MKTWAWTLTAVTVLALGGGPAAGQSTQHRQTDLDLVRERARREAKKIEPAEMDIRLKDLETRVGVLQKEGGANAYVHKRPASKSGGPESLMPAARVSERLRHKDRAAAAVPTPEVLASLKSRLADLRKELAQTRRQERVDALNRKIDALEKDVVRYEAPEGDPDRPVIVGR